MRFNLLLAFVWLAIAVPLLIVNATGKAIDPIEPGTNSMVVGAMAMVLALYNFARWWTTRLLARNRTKPALAPPPKKRRIEGASLEYNPEFDFTRQGPQSISTDDDTPRN